MGSVGDFDLPDFVHAVCADCAGAGFRGAAGQHYGVAEADLHGAGDGVGREPAAVEAANHCGGAAVGADSAGVRVGAFHSVVGLRDGGGDQVVAQHGVCAVFCGGRGALGRVGGGVRDDTAAVGVRMAGLHPSRAHRRAGAAADCGGDRVVLLPGDGDHLWDLRAGRGRAGGAGVAVSARGLRGGVQRLDDRVCGDNLLPAGHPVAAEGVAAEFVDNVGGLHIGECGDVAGAVSAVCAGAGEQAVPDIHLE